MIGSGCWSTWLYKNHLYAGWYLDFSCWLYKNHLFKHNKRNSRFCACAIMRYLDYDWLTGFRTRKAASDMSSETLSLCWGAFMLFWSNSPYGFICISLIYWSAFILICLIVCVYVWTMTISGEIATCWIHIHVTIIQLVLPHQPPDWSLQWH
jgi:hypothetical protein